MKTILTAIAVIFFISASGQESIFNGKYSGRPALIDSIRTAVGSQFTLAKMDTIDRTASIEVIELYKDSSQSRTLILHYFKVPANDGPVMRSCRIYADYDLLFPIWKRYVDIKADPEKLKKAARREVFTKDAVVRLAPHQDEWMLYW